MSFSRDIGIRPIITIPIPSRGGNMNRAWLISRNVLVALFCSTLGHAADYPAGPIRIICAYPAGGGADWVTRTVGEKLAGALGQPVLVDNRPGAGGVIGTELLAKAKPDGYTL